MKLDFYTPNGQFDLLACEIRSGREQERIADHAGSVVALEQCLNLRYGRG